MDPSLRFETDADVKRKEAAKQEILRQEQMMRERLEQERRALPSRLEDEDMEDEHERSVMGKVQALLGRRWLEKQEESKVGWEQYEGELEMKKRKMEEAGEKKSSKKHPKHGSDEESDEKRKRRKKVGSREETAMQEKGMQKKEKRRAKKEEKKQRKKEKRQRKKHKKEEEEDLWKEKEVPKPDAPPMERQSWMTSEPEHLLAKIVSSKESPPKKKEVEEASVAKERELNPYKKEGVGMPTEEEHAQAQKERIRVVGDGGRGWRAKALQRAREQKGQEIVKEAFNRERAEELKSRERVLHGGKRMQAPSQGWREERAALRREREEQEKREQQEHQAATIQASGDLNVIAAKILRAKMAGKMHVVERLEAQLAAARASVEGPSVVDDEGRKVIVVGGGPRFDRHGRAIGQAKRMDFEETPSGKRLKRMKTHGADGQRERYFRDDDMDLKTMVARERAGGDVNPDRNMAENIARSRRFDGVIDEDFDDIYGARMLDKREDYMTAERRQEKERRRAIRDHRRTEDIADRCQYCIDGNRGMSTRHMILYTGARMVLRLPDGAPLVKGHCVIFPKEHVAASVDVGDEVLDEMRNCKKMLQSMFAKEKKPRIPVFLEVAHAGRAKYHALVEVVPIPVKLVEDARIYFKKALLESDEEWAQHKKIIVTTREKRIERSVPRGFSYFNVEFGVNAGGFAHVIENADAFRAYFGREILGGLLDLEPYRWRKPPKMAGNEIYELVATFKEQFKEYQKVASTREKRERESEKECSSAQLDQSLSVQ